MSLLTPGQRVTYYPIRANNEDNRHFPAVVEAVKGSRCTLRVFRDDAPPPIGVVVRVHEKRVVASQSELLGEPIP